ncbi:MAG: tRNA 2-thiouridine(34) synthase MnmA [Bacteroidota bacterium]
MERVVVGLSGGVDSSVAAYLLKEAGYDVIGLFMKNWHDESVTISSECPWLEDSHDAMMVAQALDIPFQSIDLSKEYKERIVDYMFAEYERGRTPNPDVLCNREIKFDIFLKAAQKLGADKVATGHYCRKGEIQVGGKSYYRLLAGKDINKDQSYFLCQISQEQLAHALFPIGELTKPQVREIAQELGLVTAGKKDSQGLCFVGKVRLPEFLQQQLVPKEGRIVEIEAEHPVFHKRIPAGILAEKEIPLPQLAAPYEFSPQVGEEIGTHIGAHFYTIGQRKGLHLGGKPEPLYVIGTDVVENVVYVGMGDTHPGLYRSALFIPNADIHWIREDLCLQIGERKAFSVRIRYRQPLQQATLLCEPEGIYIQFDSPQRGITPGQFAAWYDGEELVGSGVID